MIIAKTDGGLLIIGLSRRNIESLQEGKPILKEMPGNFHFAVVFGETEMEILDYLATAGFDIPPPEFFQALPT
jgi:hypothetical protein